MSKSGSVAYVDHYPDCDLCQPKGRQDARYDALTRYGWAFLCPSHWLLECPSAQLGTGIGQRLELRKGSE